MAPLVIALVALPVRTLHGQAVVAPTDESPHIVQFVTVDADVKLEVLDWGGSGRPLVFLAGLTDEAHVFDQFAPKLTTTHHVYGITRRGFGASSAPVPANGAYAADRLGDDVLAVVEALKLDRPVLIGHSFAGEELSSIGSRHPDKVAGLIYLDAIWPYSYYDRSRGNMRLDSIDLKKSLDELLSGVTLRQRQAALELRTSLPRFEQVLREFLEQLPAAPAPPQGSAPPPLPPPVLLAISLGWQKYTEIHAPILAIVASLDRSPALKTLANAFEAGVPSARVVHWPRADHYVFKSNEAEVLREMQTFVGQLR